LFFTATMDQKPFIETRAAGAKTRRAVAAALFDFQCLAVAAAMRGQSVR
jgi:hypothetical protein